MLSLSYNHKVVKVEKDHKVHQVQLITQHCHVHHQPPSCHISLFFLTLPRLLIPSLPGQLVLNPDHVFSEEIFSNAQSKLPLV